MTCRLLSILLVFFFCVPHASAQKHKNSVIASMNAFYIPGRMAKFNLANQLGITYERGLTKQWAISAGYFVWTPKYLFSKHSEVYYIVEPRDYNSYNVQPGTLRGRHNYSKLDLSGYYKCIFGRNYISAGLGISYCWGINSYVEWYYKQPYYPYEVMSTSNKKPVHYWGIIPSVQYNYYLLGDRLSVGADIKARCYINISQVQYDYGLHLGINF